MLLIINPLFRRNARYLVHYQTQFNDLKSLDSPENKISGLVQKTLLFNYLIDPYRPCHTKHLLIYASHCCHMRGNHWL